MYMYQQMKQSNAKSNISVFISLPQIYRLHQFDEVAKRKETKNV